MDIQMEVFNVDVPITPVQGYIFKPEDLRVEQRLPGISAFMRIRNGEDFLEATIRTHIQYFDEIVAVYNQCTDRTEEILLKLYREFPEKLRIFHYLDRVYPVGSMEHAKTPPNSPNSIVNYYNFALAQTRFQVVTKLDDDHIAFEPHLAQVKANIIEQKYQLKEILCFSGLNLYRDREGKIGIYPFDPISGRGDIGFFRVTENMFFTFDRRFERSPQGHRRFVGYLYFHMKYLKKGNGYTNYELDKNPNSRYAKRKKVFDTLPPAMSLWETVEKVLPTKMDECLSLFLDKKKILYDQGREMERLVRTGVFRDEMLREIVEQYKTHE